METYSNSFYGANMLLIPKPNRDIIGKELQDSFSHEHRCKHPERNFNKLNPVIEEKANSKNPSKLTRIQGWFNTLNQWINIIHYFNRNKREKSHDHHKRLKHLSDKYLSKGMNVNFQYWVFKTERIQQRIIDNPETWKTFLLN